MSLDNIIIHRGRKFGDLFLKDILILKYARRSLKAF